MLQNRQVLKRVFPQVFETYDVRSTDDYRVPCWTCCATSPRAGGPIRTVVLLSPGIYNSAYFEHTFLAQRMASTWWKAATWWSIRTACGCAPRAGWKGWT